MNPAMAGIPVPEYMEIAKTFNPDRFDAKAIVQLAKIQKGHSQSAML